MVVVVDFPHCVTPSQVFPCVMGNNSSSSRPQVTGYYQQAPPQYQPYQQTRVYAPAGGQAYPPPGYAGGGYNGGYHYGGVRGCGLH